LEAYDLAAAILKITTDTLALPLCCEPFVADIRRTNTELVCVILYTFLDASSSSLVSFTEPDISFSMLRATESLVILLQSSNSLSPLPSFLCRLVTARLLLGPRPDSRKIDDLLMKGILVLPSTFSLSGPALQFAETLRAETWEEEGSTLRVCLSRGTQGHDCTYPPRSAVPRLRVSLESHPGLAAADAANRQRHS
jgi:hypothetical protein